jgi:acetyl-CoA carboxylase carboxyl transferase subunit alpha
MLSFEAPIKELEKKILEFETAASAGDGNARKQLDNLLKRLKKTKQDIYKKLTPYERLEVARHPNRPYTLDYIGRIFTDFLELSGDRCFGDDKAIVGGFALFDGMEVMIIGHQKGRNTKEKIARNFGMANPEGYRKAIRLFEMAEKFNRPVITFVDTSGAYPGLGAEERGQAQAIASSLYSMAKLQVPIITFIVGEGGSGGALGIAVANRVLMLENSVYSVISPEGCASILWKEDSAKPNGDTQERENTEKAAVALKMTAMDLLSLGIIDEVIKEPLGGAHQDHSEAAGYVKSAIEKYLPPLMELNAVEIVEDRYKKFRAMGVFGENA